MTPGDIMLNIGLLLGFLLGINAGVWLSYVANKRGLK